MAHGNGKPPETIDYVLVPIDPDTGSVVVKDGTAVPVMMADVEHDLTVVGIPSDLPGEQHKALVEALHDESREPANSKRRFLVLRGELGVRWKFWRMIRRDRYDEDFDEARPRS